MPTSDNGAPAAVSASYTLPDRVSVSGGRVATGVLGHGPPVILVHGTPAWSYLWRGVAERLAEHHTVYLWDMLGFGDSHARPGVAPSIARQATTLTELVAHWGLEAPALVGHDIGGGVVARAHLMEEVPARALALVDAAVLGPWNTPFTDHQQHYAEAYRTMPVDVFGDLAAVRLRSAVQTPMSPEVADAYLAPWAGQQGQNRWIDQVAAVSYEDTRDVVHRLDTVTAPTLVLWGEQDGWLDPSVGANLAAAVPGARLRTVTGAGHFLPEDAPEATAHALVEFLNG
ncbi:pimeloyl-ACP methyl ester carboxylesterase [Lipingzhangella halophila]|uniref:Pimeloyl-ACP methyl ester carboxylesterase n=1 Tax=Lipingzhangella halophila TaxID=1783352 RepID=A0A7W7W3I7_9ACTN|nr:alpha/beta hydrolase [Lipingzhangella halophila]MBB4932821.1 pimeloyl-ACP methyl ester carboxylesterase [Lipingzhangella halophila]